MDISRSILQDARKGVGLDESLTDYDGDLLPLINSAIAEVNQVGVGNFVIVENEEQTWQDLQNPLQVEGNNFFKMVPLFVILSTKLIFDPPPPSSVEFQKVYAEKLLWRLKVAYETPYTPPVVDNEL